MNAHYSNILVPTDFSEQSLLALEQAFALARILNVDITLMHVIAESGNPFSISLFSKDRPESESSEHEELCSSKLLQICERASKDSWIKVNPLLMKGRIHETIVQMADDIYARFIVMAANSSTRDSKTYSVGSTAGLVIKEATCPVLTFNGTNIREHFDTIILPLDLTRETQQKVSKAIEIAKYYNSTIRVVSVLLTDDENVVNQITSQLKDVKEFIEKRDIYTTAHIVRGSKVVGSLTSFVLDYAYESDGDLIMIMIDQKERPLERLLGSNTSELIGMSRIPVLSVVPKQ